MVVFESSLGGLERSDDLARVRADDSFRGKTGSTAFRRSVSSITFIILLAAGWVGLSYVRTIMAQKVDSPMQRDLKVSGAPSAISDSTQQVLVYAASNDTQYYHTAAHLPSHSERSALSEQAARERGLKPCPICQRPHK